MPLLTLCLAVRSAFLVIHGSLTHEQQVLYVCLFGISTHALLVYEVCGLGKCQRNDIAVPQAGCFRTILLIGSARLLGKVN